MSLEEAEAAAKKAPESTGPTTLKELVDQYLERWAVEVDLLDADPTFGPIPIKQGKTA